METANLSRYTYLSQSDDPGRQETGFGAFRFGIEPQRPSTDRHKGNKPLERKETDYDVVKLGPCDSFGSSLEETLTRPQRSQQFHNRWQLWIGWANAGWIFEILSCVISIACFGALVSVLAVSDTKEQHRILSNHLTLNGLVALLTTFFRASMMVSVGAALGQLKWNRFYQPPGSPHRPPRIRELDDLDQASRGPWGSVKIILSRSAWSLSVVGAVITVSTLALDTFAQQVLSLAPKNVPVFNASDVGQLSRSTSYDKFMKEIQETNYIPDLYTKAAINNGIFNSGSVVPPPSQCSTGNCTWPITPSLGVCGSCTDLTSRVSYTCVEQQAGTNCSYSLHDAAGYNFSVVYESSGRAYPSAGSPALVVEQFNSEFYNDSDTMLLESFIALNVPKTQQSNPSIRVCGLWYCVQAYNTSVNNGILTQEIVGNHSKTDCNVFADIGSCNFTDIPDRFNVSKDAVFNVSLNSLIGFEQTPFMNASVLFANDGQMSYLPTPDIAMALYNISDWDVAIDQLALSMSNNIRLTGDVYGDGADAYAGEVFVTVNLVHVRWVWLVFPAVLVVLSILFLIASIWQTHRLKAEAWKGNSLALLMCSMDESVRNLHSLEHELEDERFVLQYMNGRGVFAKADKTE